MSELRDPSSFLRWTKRMLEVRHQHPVLGMGEFEVLDAENPSVLAYLRRGIDYDLDGQEDIVLCVYNLSRFAQPAELQLSHLAGKQPIELMGRVRSRSSASCRSSSPSRRTASSGSPSIDPPEEH